MHSKNGVENDEVFLLLLLSFRSVTFSTQRWWNEMNCVLRFLRFIDDDCNDDLRLPLYVIDGRIVLFVRAWGLSDRSTKLKLWESVSGRVVPTAMIYSEWEYSRLLRCLLCNRRVAKFVFFFFLFVWQQKHVHHSRKIDTFVQHSVIHMVCHSLPAL